MPKQIRRVLLIDDDEVDQRIYKRAIERSGLVEEVKGFLYADEALAFLTSHPDLEIDVIFLDINMPRMNGFEFLEHATQTLGDSFAKMVVVMLTTSLVPEDEARARRVTAVRDFIRKPLSGAHIVEVAEYLDRAEPRHPTAGLSVPAAQFAVSKPGASRH